MTQQISITQAIIDAHGRLALPHDHAEPATAQSQPFSANENELFTAVKTACLRLGFVEIDAQCVASAWQRSVERTGLFDANTWPTEPEDFGMKPWPRKDAFLPCPKNLGLYAVLPDAAWVARMAKAGVPTVQLRFKSDDARAIEREVRAAVEAVKGTDALLFINDHWEAAIEAGAYGVHLGQEDIVDADLLKIREANLRLGLSSHGFAEMIRADKFSPSYIACGAIYPTTLKRMMTAPQGPGRLHMYARLMRNYPLVAIGGIDASKLPEVLASGVGSVAVVRALVVAEQPETEAASFQAAIRAAC
jgi:thiamine-phosphate pyrophosphorylase